MRSRPFTTRLAAGKRGATSMRPTSTGCSLRNPAPYWRSGSAQVWWRSDCATGGERWWGSTCPGRCWCGRRAASARRSHGGDAQGLPVRTDGVRYAVAVWVIHDVADPDQLLREAARVIQTGGKLIASDIQVHDRSDSIGRILGELTDRLHVTTLGSSPRVYGGRRSSNGRRPMASRGMSSGSSGPGRATGLRARLHSKTGPGLPCGALTTATTRPSWARPSLRWNPYPKRDNPARLVGVRGTDPEVWLTQPATVPAMVVTGARSRPDVRGWVGSLVPRQPIHGEPE